MPPFLRLLGVLLFLGLILAIFEITGLRGHFSLEFLRQTILDNRVGGLVVFILVFALGNLIQIPGWVFLAAAVLALGRTWGGVATYIAAGGSLVIRSARSDTGSAAIGARYEPPCPKRGAAARPPVNGCKSAAKPAWTGEWRAFRCSSPSMKTT